MNENPFVSVVIPCLNRAHLLRPTIESVLQQNYPFLECIVVDGGSTDGTLDILKSYEDRIRWVSEPDHGHADAINKGWKMSQGDILAWLNADDVWEVPNAASVAMAYLQAYPEVDVVYGDCGSIDLNGNVIGRSYWHEWDLEYAIEFCDHCIPQPAAFIRRSALHRVGGLNEKLILMDRDLWYRIGLNGTIRHLPVLLAHARSHSSYWHAKSADVASDCITIIRNFFSAPNVPISLRNKKRRALSNAYLRGIEYAMFGNDRFSIMLSYALKSMLVDPSNIRRTWSHVRTSALQTAKRERRMWWIVVFLNILSLPISVGRQIASVAKIGAPTIPNLSGDRDIEWSWIASQMPTGSGEALDFGTGGSFLGLIAAQRGFHVTAIDLTHIHWDYMHPDLRFLQGDLLELPLSASSFDLIINCSTIEHVGLIGRYDVKTDRPDGDLEAMAHLRTLLKSDGIMLLTIPIGRDALFAPLCRVYGSQRLPRLLDGYDIIKEAFWTKDDQNRWQITAKAEALDFEAFAGSWDARQNITALGCFVLKKSEIGN